MHGSTWLLLLCLPGTVLTASVYYPLSTLNSILNTFNVEAGSLLFFSSNDPDRVLQNITVYTDEKTEISVNDLVRKYVGTTVQKVGLKLNSTRVTVKNLNTVEDTVNMHGSIYITTKEDAEDANFFVMDNIRPANLSNNSGKKTIVVFNMFNDDTNAFRPKFHANVQFNSNDQEASMNMYMGVPGQGGKVFFHNPVKVLTTTKIVTQFFPKTEVLPVNTNVFYIMTNGSYIITTNQNWVNTKTFTTELSTTTGLMSTSDQDYLDQVVNFSADLKLNGVTFIEYVGNPTNAFQGVLSKPGDDESFDIIPAMFLSGNYMQPQLFSSLTLQTARTNKDIGKFFLQYVVIEGDANGGSTVIPPVTKKPVTPSPSVESTTKATTGHSGFVPLNYLTGTYYELDVDAGSLLFISSDDNDAMLKNITVVTDDNKEISASDLARQYVGTTVQKVGLKINSTIVAVKNLNTAAVTINLRGSIYITTKEDAEDADFFVMDNIRPVNLNSESGSKTIVIFNMFIHDPNTNRPDFHGNVQFFANGKTASMNMFMGVPGQGGDVFFQNPIEFSTTSKKVKQFFLMSEVLPVNTNVFYIKANGAFTLALTQTWANTNIFTTKQSTATGLLSTSGGQYLDQIVNFSANLTLNGITYIQHVGSPTSSFQMLLSKPGGNVSFDVGPSVSESGSYMQPQLFSSLTLQTARTNKDIGKLFLQYVVIEGEANGESTVIPPITGNPVTVQPVTVQPVSNQPVTVQPVSNQPVTVPPVTVRPVTSRPVTSPSVESTTKATLRFTWIHTTVTVFVLALL